MIDPYAPHLAEELWSRVGRTELLAHLPWPTYDESLLQVTTVTLPVQVNGKMRVTLVVPRDLDEDSVLALAKADPKVEKAIEGKSIRRVIYQEGKILNLVVK